MKASCKKIFISHYSAVAFFLAFGILASFLKEILLAYYYGTGKEVEIFRLSILLPHMLTQNCAPAFLAACLPLFGKYSEPEDSQACRIVFIANVIFSVGFFVVGILSADILARMLAPGFDDQSRELLSSALHYTWLYFFLASLSLTIRTQLLHKEIYWPGSMSSAVIGFVFIVVILFYQSFPLSFGYNNSLLVAAVCSGLAVYLVHVFASKKYRLMKVDILKFELPRKLLVPLILAISGAMLFKLINFVPRFIDRVVATTMDQGVLACLEYSFGILNIFGILIGTTVSTVVAPRFLKRYPVKGIVQALMEMKHIFIMVAVGSVAISVSAVFFSESLISLVFERGSFDNNAVQVTTNIFQWQILALPLINLTLVLSQLFIIIEKVKFLLFAVFSKVILKALSIFFLIKYLEESIFGITLFISEIIYLSALILFIVRFSSFKINEKDY